LGPERSLAAREGNGGPGLTSPLASAAEGRNDLNPQETRNQRRLFVPWPSIWPIILNVWLAGLPGDITARRLSCEGTSLPRPGTAPAWQRLAGAAWALKGFGLGGWAEPIPRRGLLDCRLRLRFRLIQNVIQQSLARKHGSGRWWQRDKPPLWSGRGTASTGGGGFGAAPRARSGLRPAEPATTPSDVSRPEPRREAGRTQPK